MKITEEWRIFDPNDTRTHPEGLARIEVEFDDGASFTGQYSRDVGWFVTVGSVPANATVRRWRYISETPDL